MLCLKKTHDIVISYLNGDIIKSRNLQLSLNSFINSLFLETNPIPIKLAMNLMGFEVGGVKQPLWEMDLESSKTIKNRDEKSKN